MKLVDVVRDLDNIDDNFVIFMSDLEDPGSDIILVYVDRDVDDDIYAENAAVNRSVEGVHYRYLLEIFIAKEVIEDLTAHLGKKPTDLEMAHRIYYYGIYDA